MRKMFSVAMCAAIISWVGTANAVSVNYDNSGAIYYTTALTGYQTKANQMVGMEFTVTFTGGATQTATWTNLSGNNSGFVLSLGDGKTFSILMPDNDDTYSAIWSVDDGSRSNYSIDKIMIDAGAGNAVFDVWANDTGTDGSSIGEAFNVARFGSGFDILATYSGRVALTGNAPVGDLYRYLTIDFTDGGFGDGNSGDYLQFNADTDSLKIAGDLKPVPEPATMLLFGSGLVGLAAVSRRKK